MLVHSEVQVAGSTKHKYYLFKPQVIISSDKLNNYTTYTRRQEVTSTSTLMDNHTSTFMLVKAVQQLQ